MPSRRIMVVAALTAVGTDVFMHVVVRGWAARRIAEGKGGSWTRALMVL